MLNVQEREWREFKLSKVFSIVSTASSIDKGKLKYKAGEYPYITRSENNNGINDFICSQEPFAMDSGNCITIGLDTQTAFYQNYPFYTGQNIQILRNEHLNVFNAKFVLPLLKNVMTIFSWGSNGATLTRLKRSLILLPVDGKNNPDWSFMENYITERQAVLESQYIERVKKSLPQSKEVPLLREKEWKEFFIEKIFNVSSGKRLTKNDMVIGNRPFIGATDSNNGITNFVKNTNVSLDSNVLGVNYNGSVVETFYHPYECVFSDDVKRFSLKNTEGNKFVYLFLKSIILQQKVKYAYGYKFNEKRMNKQQLLLPIDDNGNPDFKYMEQYSKNIMYNKLTTYLAQKDQL